jgi:hypothetical protein
MRYSTKVNDFIEIATGEKPGKRPQRPSEVILNL